MSRWLACRTNVAHWQSPFCRRLDAAFVERGMRLVDLPWTTFEVLEYDRDHFTRSGYCKFCEALAAACARHGVTGDLVVLADSTVDWLNDGARVADAALARCMGRHGIRARVCSHSGSGFVALRDIGRDFGSLAQSALRCDPSLRRATWLVVGGWNDHPFSVAQVREALDALLLDVPTRSERRL